MRGKKKKDENENGSIMTFFFPLCQNNNFEKKNLSFRIKKIVTSKSPTRKV